MSEKRKVIAISGGFDPVHIGHVQMIEAAAELGDVLVIVNSDDWLLRKKATSSCHGMRRLTLCLSSKV